MAEDSEVTSNFIIKDRIKKSYRIPELDEKIRKRRTKSETKLLEKVSKILNAPNPQETKNKTQITMPFIDGKKLSQHLDEFPLTKQKEILKQIGIDIAKLHNENIIHGDLTTSNMILVENLKSTTTPPSFISPNFNKSSTLKSSSRKIVTKSDFEPSMSEAEPSVFFIDFGLGFHSHRIEDKAVDLHLLKEALEAKHFRHWEVLFKEFVKGYKNQKVLEQLRKVESRGRYKERC